MATKKETKVKSKDILLEPINLSKITIPIIGRSPLMMDKFPEESRLAILGKQGGISKTGKKKVRDTNKEVQDAIHWIDNKKTKVGFPSSGFKKGMIESTSFVGDKFFSKKLLCGAIRITNSVDGLIPIKYKKQSVLEHFIPPNTKFSPIFHDWSCDLEIMFDANNISSQDIITLINYSGFYVGIGGWRPKSGGGGSGEYGTYEVDIKKLKK